MREKLRVLQTLPPSRAERLLLQPGAPPPAQACRPVRGLGSRTSPSISWSQDDPKGALCSSRGGITLFIAASQQDAEATLVPKTFHNCRSPE